MELPCAMQDVWGNHSRPADFPEGKIKEFLLKSGVSKANWKADPCGWWDESYLTDEEKGPAFLARYDEFAKIATGEAPWDQEKLIACLDVLEKGWMKGRHKVFWNPGGRTLREPCLSPLIREPLERISKKVAEEMEEVSRILRGGGEVRATFPRPKVEEVAGGTLLKALRGKKESGLIFPLCEGRFANLEKMPHLLIAGTTGSGKSSFLESLLISLALGNAWDEAKFLLFDPKQVELSRFAGLPHIYYAGVMRDDDGAVTDPDEMVAALEEVEELMMERLSMMKAARVRDLKEYEKKKGEKLWRLVFAIDEFADVSSQMGKAFSGPLGRVAAMSRAAGIHLILATQKPTRDVISPIIKANVPGRIAFRVASATDSRVILDETGAELLRGQGHGIFKHPEYGRFEFVGPWAGEGAVDRLVEKCAPVYENSRNEKGLKKLYWRMLVDLRWARTIAYAPENLN